MPGKCHFITDKLTRRETEVVQALIEHECQVKAICKALIIAPSTLRTHLFAIGIKTKCNSKGQLLAKYIKTPELFGGVEL